MNNGRRKTLTDFKEYCHLEKDGEALYEAIRKDIIRGLVTTAALALLREAGVTLEMDRNEILEKLKKVLGESDKEGLIAKLAKEESIRLGKIYTSEKYESGLRSLEVAQEDIRDQIAKALKEAQDGAALAYRGQLEIVIEALTTKWE